jgi:hypothetical protein
MSGLLLLSLLIATVVIPFRVVRTGEKQDVRRSVTVFVAFAALYMFALRFVYARLA